MILNCYEAEKSPISDFTNNEVTEEKGFLIKCQQKKLRKYDEKDMFLKVSLQKSSKTDPNYSNVRKKQK